MIRIQHIQDRLQRALPGPQAHQRAIPLNRARKPYDPEVLPNARESGVLLLLYRGENDQLYFPLMKRQEYDGTHSGQVSLPGGRKEEEDQNIVATALRETWEEIGVEPSEVRILGSLTQLYIPPSNYLVSPAVGFVPFEPQFVPDPREVRELFQVPVSALFDDDLFLTTDMMVRNIKMRDIPYYHLNSEIVWGATAMILSEFRVILAESGVGS